MTVAELTRSLAGAIERSFPGDIWVRGQIRNLGRRSGGNVFFTLAEPAPAGETPDAQLRVALFSSDRDAVNRLLIARGSVRM